MYAGEAGQDGRGGEWSVDLTGDGWGEDPKVVIAAEYGNADIPFPMTTPANYAMLSGTVSDAGTIDIVGYNASGWVNFMGLQVEVVPEPATLALFGLGGLLLRKRR